MVSGDMSASSSKFSVPRIRRDGGTPSYTRLNDVSFAPDISSQKSAPSHRTELIIAPPIRRAARRWQHTTGDVIRPCTCDRKLLLPRTVNSVAVVATTHSAVTGGCRTGRNPQFGGFLPPMPTSSCSPAQCGEVDVQRPNWPTVNVAAGACVIFTNGWMCARQRVADPGSRSCARVALAWLRCGTSLLVRLSA